jgi:hypothetical protein
VCAHEARPNAPHGIEAAFGDVIDSAKQILIKDEIRLDRTDVCAVLDHEVEVAELIPECVFGKFVEAVILALVRKRA